MDWLPEEARKMLDQLVEMALRLGRDPTFAEVDQDPTMPKANSYAYYFGCFTNAQQKAHRIAFVYKKQEPPLPAGKIFSKEEEEEMSRRAITDEEYVVGAIRLQKELGHFPNVTDVRNDKRCPSVASYERRFGAVWPGVKAAILRKANEMGINEENIDNYPPPEPKKPKLKPEPVVTLEPTSKPEPIPTPKPTTEEDNFMSETTNPTTTKPADSDIQFPSPFLGSSGISCEDPLSSDTRIPPPPIRKFEPDNDYNPKAEGVAEAILGPEEKPEPSATFDSNVPEPEPEPPKAELALLSVLSGISSEPILPSEVEPEGNKVISLLPQTKVVSPKVEGYASVFATSGLIPLQKTVLGVPVSQKYSGLNLILNGQTVAFPEPQEGVFYIVERKIASIAKSSGRDTYDLLIPEKYDANENEITIVEFSIL